MTEKTKRGRGRPRKQNPRSAVVTCATTGAERIMVQRAAAAEGLSVSEWVHRAITDRLAACR